MKIAIIGAGASGLACALECERLGVYPDIFEKDRSVGWIWPSVVLWPKFFYYGKGDPLEVLRKNYNLNIKPLAPFKKLIMKSPNKEAIVQGDLGYFFEKGKGIDSKENQIFRELKKTSLHLNHTADYRELSKKYDWVVITTGNEIFSRELGIWEDEGVVNAIGGIAIGRFDPNTVVAYLNTSYAGSGYARITPISSTQAVVDLYDIGHHRQELDTLFSRFLEYEKLDNLDFLYKYIPPTFSTGTVKKFQTGNILIAGRAAALVDRFIGVGGFECISSGILAARAIIQGLDYASLVRPLRSHIENISSYRDLIENLDNNNYDRLVTILNTPGLKQLLYTSGFNFAEIGGSILKHIVE